MKALMFGWEFPPHILGGLGTASYGLTKGMSEQPDMDITFVIPKLDFYVVGEKVLPESIKS